MPGWTAAGSHRQAAPAQPGTKQLHLPPASFLESEEGEEEAETKEPQGWGATPPGQGFRAGGSLGGR